VAYLLGHLVYASIQCGKFHEHEHSLTAIKCLYSYRTRMIAASNTVNYDVTNYIK